MAAQCETYIPLASPARRLVRLYDEVTRTLVSTLTGIHSDSTPGHSNRVFALKFDPRDDNMIVSGGWDSTVQIHDIRVGGAVRSIYGPHICGDAIDVAGDGVLLTGSWRADEQLQLWDLGSGRLIQGIAWNTGAATAAASGGGAVLPGSGSSVAPGGLTKRGGVNGYPGSLGDDALQAAAAAPPPRPLPCLLYAAAFSHDAGGTLIAAGGSGANEAKVFDRSAMLAAASPTNPRGADGGGGGWPVLCSTVTGLSRAVFSLDWHEGSALAIGGGSGPIIIWDVGKDRERDFNGEGWVA